MHATLEPLTVIIRVHDQTEDSFVWSCTATLDRATGSARLYGAIQAPTLSQVRALKEILLASGIQQILWERRTGVRRRLVSLKLKPRKGTE